MIHSIPPWLLILKLEALKLAAKASGCQQNQAATPRCSLGSNSSEKQIMQINKSHLRSTIELRYQLGMWLKLRARRGVQGAQA
jgi:hypothetical protein